MAQTQMFGWCFGCGKSMSWGAYHAKAVPSTWRTGGMEMEPCGPVWPGVRVRDQEEADRLIPELLSIKAPGHIVEWVPGRGRISLAPWLPKTDAEALHPDPEIDRELRAERDDGRAIDRAAGITEGWHRGWKPIRWLRIVADPRGPLVDIADVRAVVAQCRDAKVPVWIERLGSNLWETTSEGLVPCPRSPALLLRELPDVYHSKPDTTPYAPGQPVPSRAR